MNDSRKKPWWLIVTAALAVILTLYYYTDSWIVVTLFLAAAAIFMSYRAKRGGRQSLHACVRCGARLNPNARQCASCGSASWTIRN